jgi:hypothetical protein
MIRSLVYLYKIDDNDEVDCFTISGHKQKGEIRWVVLQVDFRNYWFGGWVGHRADRFDCGLVTGLIGLIMGLLALIF